MGVVGETNSGPRRFAAELLEVGAAGYAAGAVERLLEAQPGLNGRYEASAMVWRENLESRIRELGSAVRRDDPSAFGRQLLWARAAFEARGLPVGDLVSSLESVRATLEAELPAAAMGSVRGVLDFGLRVLGEDAGGADVFESEFAGLDGGDLAGVLASRYVLACLEGDRRGAMELLTGAVSRGELAVEAALVEVLGKAHREIGRMWHVNEITIGEEHFATSTTEYVIAALFASAKPKVWNGRRVVVSGVMGETHNVASRIVASVFDLAGWRAIELGSDVPPMDLALSAIHFDADVLALSATITTHTRAVERTVQSLREVDPGGRVKVLVGGQAFLTERGADVAKELGADGFAMDPREAVKVAGEWFGV